MGYIPLFVTAPLIIVPLGELAHDSRPIRGTYDGNRVWMSTVKRGPELYPSGGGQFHISHLGLARDDRPRHLLVPVMYDSDSPLFPSRSRYAAGRYHYIKYGFDSDLVRMMLSSRFTSAPIGPIERFNDQPDPRPVNDIFRAFQSSLAPTTHTRIEPLMDTVINATGAQFDFLPRADGGYEFYLLQARYRRMTRWDLLPKKGGEGMEWKEVTRWQSDWVQPFYVVASGPDRFFVTALGRLIAAPTGAKPNTPLQSVWDGSPVRAILHDAAADRDYVFTDKEFFAVGHPATARLHRIAQMSGGTADEALATLAKCAAVVKANTTALFKP